MAYTKHTWVTGETITAANLNHLEDGVEGAFSESADINTYIGISTIALSPTTGYYISGAGNKSPSSAGKMQTVHLLDKETIVVDFDSGTTVSIGAISMQVGASYKVLASNGGSASNVHFSYTASEEMDVIISWITSTGATITKHGQSNIVTDYNKIRNVAANVPFCISPISLIRENGYRKTDGTIFGTTTLYFHSSFDLAQGETISVHYKDAPTSVVILGVFDENSNFTIIKQGGGTSNQGDILYTAPANVSVSVSGNGADYSVFYVDKLLTNSKIMGQMLSSITPDLYSIDDNRVPWEFALDKILCIGDSLTIGVPSWTATMPNPMKQCYPWYLSRMINTDVTNAGVSGITTKDWYNNQYSNYTMSNYNAVIIFLGTNGGLTDTLATDVDPYNDYTQYADTNTGCYCKLIEHIKEDNSNCIIVLVNIWSVATGSDTTRSVIEQIASKYGLPLVTTTEMAYKVNPAYHWNVDNVHLTKTGYLALAHKVCTSMKNYFASNVNAANVGMTL